MVVICGDNLDNLLAGEIGEDSLCGLGGNDTLLVWVVMTL
jgi:hypothetical protein